MIGLTIITQLVYWYRDLKTPGSYADSELKEIVKVERKETKVPTSQALAVVDYMTPYEQPWTDREDFRLNAYYSRQDIQESQDDIGPRISERLTLHSDYSEVRKSNSQDTGCRFQESPESDYNYSAVRNIKPPMEYQSYCNGPNHSGQSVYDGPSYSGQSEWSGPSYSGQSEWSGPSYSGQSVWSGPTYLGQSEWGVYGSSMENPDRMEWNSYDSGIRIPENPEWIGNERSYSVHTEVNGPVSNRLEPSNPHGNNDDERRRRWERNEMDYMGQDSFENILAKLQSSIND